MSGPRHQKPLSDWKTQLGLAVVIQQFCISLCTALVAAQCGELYNHSIISAWLNFPSSAGTKVDPSAFSLKYLLKLFALETKLGYTFYHCLPKILNPNIIVWIGNKNSESMKINSTQGTSTPLALRCKDYSQLKWRTWTSLASFLSFNPPFNYVDASS